MSKETKRNQSSLTTEDCDILTIEAAAALLGLSVHTLYRKARLKVVPGTKKLGTWRFSRRKLVEWVEAG